MSPANDQQAAEQWREIPQHAGYQVSDMGRVRSLDRKVSGRRGGVETLISCKGRLLYPTRMRRGYMTLRLGKKKFLVHRLVLAAFVGQCPPGHEGAHWDGDRQNNRLTNLRYATYAENAADKVRHGTSGRGEEGWAAKLTALQVGEIRTLSASLTQRQLADRYGVQRSTVWKILSNKSWAHLGEPEGVDSNTRPPNPSIEAQEREGTR